jgi:hypothetical protein
MFNKITASLGVNGGHEVNSGMIKIKIQVTSAGQGAPE